MDVISLGSLCGPNEIQIDSTSDWSDDSRRLQGISCIGVARIFGQGGSAKTQVGPKNFPDQNILNSPPGDNFFGKKIFRTITLQLLS
jgi:hypothetical protein